MSKRNVFSVAFAVLAVLSLAVSFAVAQQVATEKEPAAQLYIRTIPNGARILIDGQLKGISDRLITLPKGIGRVDLEIHLDGYKPEREDVAISEGRITRVVVQLKKGESLTVDTTVHSSKAAHAKKEKPPLRATIEADVEAKSPATAESIGHGLGWLQLQRRRASGAGRMEALGIQPPAVRLVIEPDKLVFEGKETTWEELPKLLEAVPDRESTALEIAVVPAGATGTTAIEKKEEAIVKAVMIANQSGLTQFRLIEGDGSMEDKQFGSRVQKYTDPVRDQLEAGAKEIQARAKEYQEHFQKQLEANARQLEAEIKQLRPSREVLKVVQLVIGKDAMAFQGQVTSWEELPKLLEAVPDRENTTVAIIFEHGDLSTKQREEATAKATKLAKDLGFRDRVLTGDRLSTGLFEHQVESTRKFVRLVIGKDGMTFEGQETSWEKLPVLLKEVSDRKNTVLELAFESQEVLEGIRHKNVVRAARLSSQFGFEYLSQIGVHPLGSKGSPPQPRKQTDPAGPEPPARPEPPAKPEPPAPPEPPTKPNPAGAREPATGPSMR